MLFFNSDGVIPVKGIVIDGVVVDVDGNVVVVIDGVVDVEGVIVDEGVVVVDEGLVVVVDDGFVTSSHFHTLGMSVIYKAFWNK